MDSCVDIKVSAHDAFKTMVNKGNNKITEHRAIFQKVKAKFISQQTDKITVSISVHWC
jgi:hypothetical protein